MPPIEAIQARASLYANIRRFMHERDVLEVETPYLSTACNSDPNLENLELSLKLGQGLQTYYLHTSPEFPMKRLLAEHPVSIFQIARVFRNGERGRVHHPEFSMLEWYRVGFDHHQLMDELNALLIDLGLEPAEQTSYYSAFMHSPLALDPHRCQIEELQALAQHHGLATKTQERSVLLEFLFSHHVAPSLGLTQPQMVYDYPESQAALAKLRVDGDITVAERFECFIEGLEIANGYHELNDAKELHARFREEQNQAGQKAITSGPLDQRLIDSTDHLPDCAGVALGLDRLLMILLNLSRIDEVLCFPVEMA